MGFKFNPGCNCCEDACVTMCQEGTNPRQYQLDVPEDTIFDGGGCDECSNAEGVFLLDFVSQAQGSCIYQSPQFDVGCGEDDLRRWVVLFSQVFSGGAVSMNIMALISNGVRFSTSVPQSGSPPLAACDFDNLAIPFSTGIIGPCDSESGKEVYLTAIL